MIYDCTPPPVVQHRPAIVRALAHVAHALHLHHAQPLQLCGVPDLETITVTAPELPDVPFPDEPDTPYTRDGWYGGGSWYGGSGGAYGVPPSRPPTHRPPAARPAPEVTVQAAPLTFLLFMLLALRGRRRITCE